MMSQTMTKSFILSSTDFLVVLLLVILPLHLVAELFITRRAFRFIITANNFPISSHAAEDMELPTQTEEEAATKVVNENHKH